MRIFFIMLLLATLPPREASIVLEGGVHFVIHFDADVESSAALRRGKDVAERAWKEACVGGQKVQCREGEYYKGVVYLAKDGHCFLEIRGKKGILLGYDASYKFMEYAQFICASGDVPAIQYYY